MGKRIDGANIPESLRFPIPGIAGNDDMDFFDKLQLKEYVINVDSVSCWLLTCKQEIVRVINIIPRSKTVIYLCCIEVQNKQNFFDVPIESKHFNIYSACRQSHMEDSHVKLILLSDVNWKLIRLEYHDSDVFIPLLHTNSAQM